MEAGVEEGAVPERLVGVLLQDLPEVQLAAGVDVLFVGAVTLLPRAVPTVLLYLGTCGTERYRQYLNMSGHTPPAYRAGSTSVPRHLWYGEVPSVPAPLQWIPAIRCLSFHHGHRTSTLRHWTFSKSLKKRKQRRNT